MTDLAGHPDLIVVMGDTMTDILAQVSDAPAVGSDVPARIVYRGGGSAANVAAWLAYLGAPVALVSRVGDDVLGASAVESLDQAGVHAWIVRDPDAPTGACIVIVTPDGERTMLPDPGANDRLAPTDLPSGALMPGRHLHLSAYPLLREGSRAAALAALETARRAGATISVDASSAAPLLALGPTVFLTWTTPADIVFANAEEAAILTGVDDPSAAAAALCGSFSLAVVKAGAGGAFARAASGEEWWVAAAPVPGAADQATSIDTTGAGDAFAAGFLGQWHRGAPVAEALEAAARISARAVGRVGGRP